MGRCLLGYMEGYKYSVQKDKQESTVVDRRQIMNTGPVGSLGSSPISLVIMSLILNKTLLICRVFPYLNPLDIKYS